MKKVKVTVVSTKSDVKAGMKYASSNSECPIGRALNRALKQIDKSLSGTISWGGTIHVYKAIPSGQRNNWIATFSPDGLKTMPTGFGGTPEHTKYISTPRRFSFILEY